MQLTLDNSTLKIKEKESADTWPRIVTYMRANSKHNKNMVTVGIFILLATIILVCGKRIRSMGKVNLSTPMVKLKMDSMTIIHFIPSDFEYNLF